MNAGAVKLIIGAASAATVVVPMLGREPEPQVVEPGVRSEVVYVMQTTTTEPPHIWIVLDESQPLDSVDVLIVQEKLKSLGYDVFIDGVYGPQTEEAVRQFQADHHLFVDGIVGPVTTRALGLEHILGHTSDPPPAPPPTWRGP